jgi:hypothetical protein
MGKKSRDKGAQFERETVHLFQAHGVAAERVPLSGAAGGSYTGDVSLPVLGKDVKIECKRRAAGFKSIYGWMGDNYALVVRDDRCPPLAILRAEDLAKLIYAAGVVQMEA